MKNESPAVSSISQTRCYLGTSGELTEVFDFLTDVQGHLDTAITAHGKICIMVFHCVTAIENPFVMLMSVVRMKTHPIGLYCYINYIL